MRKTISRSLLLTFLFTTTIVQSQITCSPKDSILFEQKIQELNRVQANSFGDTLIHVGKSFLKTPYVEKTLEVGENETLVINLRGLDCTTFVENVLAFSLLLRNGKTAFNDFAKTLETIRYRDGELSGYPSRLHYFTDWIRNNNEKGLVVDITSDLGGIELQKPINFMGTHRELYPFLSDDSNYEAMLKVEGELAEETLHILPQNQIEAVEDNIKSADIIALATTIKGLDVIHTGLALRMDNGRIHLLHASISGKVTITKEPLTDYLKGIKSNSGIIVARPQ